MKNSKKVLAATLAAVTVLSSFSAISCSAESNATAYPTVTYGEESETAFVVIMWSENDEGEITITGCSPMYSSRVCDYPTTNVMCSFMFKGRLELPSHINDKPVIAINGINIAKAVGAKTVIINENITDISENAFGKGISVMTTDKERREKPMYFYSRYQN